MFRLDFNHGHDLVQIEKPNGRGTAFPEAYVFKLGRQFGTLIKNTWKIKWSTFLRYCLFLIKNGKKIYIYFIFSNSSHLWWRHERPDAVFKENHSTKFKLKLVEWFLRNRFSNEFDHIWLNLQIPCAFSGINFVDRLTTTYRNSQLFCIDV